MKHRYIFSALIAGVLLLAASLSPAVESNAAAPGEAIHKHSTKDAKNEMAGKAKAGPKVKLADLVDINAASKAQLMKLPGIHGAEADRIIAGRPYGSQAWLVSNKIIPETVYVGIKDRIIAMQHQPIPKNSAAGGKKAK